MALVTFECVRKSILCALHINWYCTHLVGFLVTLVHPTLSRYQNHTSTVVLVSITLILNGVNSGHDIGDLLCVCILRIFHVCTHIQGTINLHSFLALNSSHIIYKFPNLNSTFIFMSTIIFLSFVNWRCGWGLFCTSEYENILFTCIHGTRYNFYSFLALNSTYNISGVPDLISIFILMSITII